MMVICNKADDSRCEKCNHSIPHNPDDDPVDNCREWEVCVASNQELFSVRCINVKSKTGKKILNNLDGKHNNRCKYSISDFEPGKIVRSKVNGLSHVVTSNYGDRATAVRSIDITNPSEWEIMN